MASPRSNPATSAVPPYNPRQLALVPGTRLGVYEVTALIGEGGMGQVYRATDTKLRRPVAIKILPPSLAADRHRLARFQREAEILASLNHPNIAQIHGLEESGGIKALVMELVEGEDLSQLLARGVMPLSEALPIAKQIAEALEAAHEQGIIHRDLKPANIKVRPDGTVKVLDFGLARANDPSGGSTADANSPTLAAHATLMGTILGTTAYMAPEQARGGTVDKRADVWAFGVVLWEMVAGRRVFEGATMSDTLAFVLTKDPDRTTLPATTPLRLQRLLARCLDRDPRMRLRDIGEARVEIERTIAGVGDGAVTSTSSPATSSAPRRRLPWMIAIAAVLAAVAFAVPAVQYLRETPPPETRTEIVTPATDQPASFALSPDGRQIVFVSSGDGTSRLWLRPLATTTAQPLGGTEGGRHPFWAPDSRSIGFFTDTALKRLDLGGGAPQTVAPVSSGAGGTWSADGFIVFAPSPTGPLMRVPAAGGSAVAVTVFGPREMGHRWPQMLPDGRRFLFYAGGLPDAAGIYLGALDGSPHKRLTLSESAGVYLAAGPGRAETSRGRGWLLWVRAGVLVAQHLDIGMAALTGEPVTLADGIDVDMSERSAASVAATGLVAYRTGAARQRRLTWFDRSGTARGTVGGTDATWGRPRVSPDGRRVAVGDTVQGNQDLWLLDGTRTSRFTFDSATEDICIWSPDGTRIVFTSTRTGGGDLYQKLTSGAGMEELLVASDGVKTPSSWSADGRFVLFHSTDPKTSSDLWVVPMAGDRKPSVFLKTPAREVWGAFSPDGRWVAYHSNESGRAEVYVRPFVPPGTAAPGGVWQVSTAGGIHPVWRPDGKELYYLDPAGAMMAAPITITGGTLEPGAPTALFSTRILGGGVDAGQGRQYDVAPDGRFLINTVLDNAGVPITLIQNWQPDAKK